MNTKILILFVLLGLSFSSNILTASDESIFEQFQDFLKIYQKRYTTIEEFQLRWEIFRENYKNIETFNYMAAASNEEVTHENGVTQFFDLTPEEFAKQYLTLNISHLQKIKALKSQNKLIANFHDGAAPEAWDWREKGVVSVVKNQGMCGSCWAFSAVGNIEAQYAIKTNQSVLFSEQQLVDCDKVDQGCNGGLMEDAFKYVEGAHGIMQASDYSYSGKQGSCKYEESKALAKVTGYKFAGTEDENQIKQILYENGPLAIAINATPLQFYFGGVFNPWFNWMCNPKSINHGVLLVGYGVSGSKAYWIVKNSWGSGWGEKGFFRIIAGKGACGLNTYVITAEVDVASN
jgi:cathepsin F